MSTLREFGDLNAVLVDAGISRAQLATLLTAPVETRRQLEAMAARSGVELSALPPTVRRDAEWTCTICTERKACKRWLRSSEAPGPAAFCPNAPAFRRQLRRDAVAGAAHEASAV